MENEVLTVEEKKEILSSRIKQFCIERYQHELNLKTAIVRGMEQAIADANNAIEILTTAIQVHTDELNSLS